MRTDLINTGVLVGKKPCTDLRASARKVSTWPTKTGMTPTELRLTYILLITTVSRKEEKEIGMSNKR